MKLDQFNFVMIGAEGGERRGDGVVTFRWKSSPFPADFPAMDYFFSILLIQHTIYHMTVDPTTISMPPQSTTVVSPEGKTPSETSPLTGNDRNASDIESGPSFSSPSPTPTWSEAFAFVSPYLLPRDRHHAMLAFFALFTVLLEKVGAY
jgi:hypothetical protein